MERERESINTGEPCAQCACQLDQRQSKEEAGKPNGVKFWRQGVG